MNGPSLGYLNALGTGLDLLPAAAVPPPDPFAAGAQQAGIAPPVEAARAPAPPAVDTISAAAGLPSLGSLDLRKLGAPAPAPTMMDGNNSASVPGPALNVPGMSPPPAPAPIMGPINPDAAPVQTVSAPGPKAPSAGPSPLTFSADTADGLPDVSYQQVGGGGTIPAHEAPTRGPLANAALMASFDPEGEAATHGDFRNQLHASAESAFYEDQARQAMAQQEAAQKVAAQRAFQTEQLQLDYADQIQKLGQMRYDDNRWWSNKSTLGKIGTTMLVALGSLEALGNGGVNQAYNAVQGEIDRDAADQRLQYESGLAQANGVHTAFDMMMQRYKNEDAAEAAVRAAGNAAAEAKLGALHAQYGGVESANAAEMLRAQLEKARLQTMANGLKLMPAQTSAPKYAVSVRGHQLPGTFDEKRAQEIGLEHAVKPAEKMDETVTKANIDSRLQQQKFEGEGTLQDRKLAVETAAKAAEKKDKAKENAVVLPNGETVYAPTSQEATTLRGLSTSVSNASQLVREAKELRKGGAFLASPSKAKRLKQIQAELTLAFKDRGGLGALSGPDMDLAREGTTDLLAFPGIGTDDALDAFDKTTHRALQNRVKTISGAPDNAQGNLSADAKASLQLHGKK